MLYCDVHGHSTKKNVFMYGCNSSAFGSSYFGCTDAHAKGLRREQLFPKLFRSPPSLVRLTISFYFYNRCLVLTLDSRARVAIDLTVGHSERCAYVSYKDCHYDVDKKKENTGRAAVARECAMIHSYTLEASLCGFDLVDGASAQGALVCGLPCRQLSSPKYC